MVDRHRGNDIDGLTDIFFAQAEAFQAGRQAEPDIEIVEAARGVRTPSARSMRAIASGAASALKPIA